MRNYPKIIKNLNLGQEFNTIANSGFFLKGTVDVENDLVTFFYSNGTNSSPNNIEEFPTSDLIIVKKPMKDEIKQKEKQRRKVFKELRGM